MFIWVTVTLLSAQSNLAILLWPLTSIGHFHQQNCHPLEYFSFRTILYKPVAMVVHENPSRSAVSEILRCQPMWPHSKSLMLHYTSYWPQMCWLYLILFPNDHLLLKVTHIQYLHLYCCLHVLSEISYCLWNQDHERVAFKCFVVGNNKM